MEKMWTEVHRFILQLKNVNILWISRIVHSNKCFILNFTDLNGIAQLLIDKGADVNITNKYGNTPLHVATISCKFFK